MYAFRRLLPFGALALFSALAQDADTAPPAPAPEVPVVPAVPPVPRSPGRGLANPSPAPGRLPVQENIPLAERKITERIDSPKLTGNDLGELYRQWTGRRVVVSAAAAVAEFSFVQEASVEDPLTYKQAAELLKMAALTEGFVFVPASDGIERLLYSPTAGNNPKGLVGVYSETDILPEGDEVIAYVMPFRFLKPDQAVTLFQNIIGQAGGYGSIVSVPNASALVITENTSVIRKLIDLKEQIDKPSTDVQRAFIKVTFADVTELAQTLNELLSPQQGSGTTGTTAAVQRIEAPQTPGAPPAPGGANAGGGSSVAGEGTPIQIVPDPRTNRIFVMGRPVDVKFVESLVAEFDTKTDDRNFLRRKLRFLSATDFLAVGETALTRAFSGTGTGGAGGQGSTGANFGSGGNRGGSSTGGFGGGSNRGGGGGSSRASAIGGSNSSSGSFGGGGFGGGSSSGSSLGSSTLSENNVSTAPISILVGRTMLVADNITNSILVQGPPASVEIIEKLLDQVDVKADQVMISTVFGQLTLNESRDLGINYLTTFTRPGDNGGLAGSVNNGGAALVDPGSLLVPALGGVGGFPSPSPSGLALYGRIGSAFNVYLNALESTGNFTVLSRPSIYTANNKMGVISSGQQIAVPTGTNSTGLNGNFQTQIEYKDVVLKLEVIPLINSVDEITLQIALTSDEVGGFQNVEGVGDVPTILTRAMTTTVTVPNNQTVVLGGLIISRDRDQTTGIPILRSIPGIGRLFESTTKDKEKSELLIFMQPSIVRTDSDLDSVQTDMDRRYSITPSIRKFADGPGAIPPPDGIVPEQEKARGEAVPVAPVPVAQPAAPVEVATPKRKIAPRGKR
jgi:general secretion pathway protein D